MAFEGLRVLVGRTRTPCSHPGSDVQNSIFAEKSVSIWRGDWPRKLNSVGLSPFFVAVAAFLAPPRAELCDACGRLAARTTSAPGQPEQASSGTLRDRRDRFSRCRRRARGQRLRCRSHGSRRPTGLRPCDGHQRSAKPLSHFRQVLGRSQQQGMSGVQQSCSSGRVDLRCHQTTFVDANSIEVYGHVSCSPEAQFPLHDRETARPYPEPIGKSIARANSHYKLRLLRSLVRPLSDSAFAMTL